MDMIAVVQGQPFTEMPLDLYIPPDALEVFLEAFQGPLDLLLYLIKKQNLDILDIPVAEITRQYMSYVDLMKEIRFELAAEYLVMAAMLAEIKSRLLLPRPVEANSEELDPRAELVRRLQEYEQIKVAAERLDQAPQIGRDIFIARAEIPELDIPRPLPKVDLKELVMAFADVMRRMALTKHHAIRADSLSVRERMTEVLARIKQDKFVEFNQLFSVEEGKLGVVVTFIAILELLKQALIDIVQHEPFSPIHVKGKQETQVELV